MSGHVPAFLSILLAWIISGTVLIGLGTLPFRWIGRAVNLSDLFWAGLAVAVAVLQIWHLAFSVNSFADILLISASVIGIVWNRQSLREMCLRAGGLGFWPIVLFGLIVSSLAFRATGVCEHFDTGLYGATAVRWIVTYPIVPGLANLHGRLGFNSNAFLCVAAMGQGIWRDAGHHLVGGLLVSAFWATIAPRIVRILRSESAPSSDWFHAILMIPCLYWTTHAHIIGTITDLPVTIIALVAGGIIVEELESNREAQNSQARILLAVSLLSLAVTFKFSVAVFAALLSAIGLVLLWQAPVSRSLRYKSICLSVAISSILVIPWIVGNIILTGLPFYPMSIFGLNVDWRVSSLATLWMRDWLRSWARTPFASMAETQGFHWLSAWFQRNILFREAFQIPVILTLLGGVATLAFSLFGVKDSSRRQLWVVVPSLVSLVFWFVQAPAPRFAEAALWTAAASLVAMSILLSGATVQSVATRRSIFAGILLVAAWCLAPHRLWRDVYYPLVLSNAPLAMPNAGVVPVSTDSGLVVYWRKDGQQCWDAPIPCTPYFDKTLRLRGGDNMRWGFDSDTPQSRSDLVAMWALRECAATDLKCEARRRDPVFADHGGE